MLGLFSGEVLNSLVCLDVHFDVLESAVLVLGV
jgi:hypothetical protein